MKPSGLCDLELVHYQDPDGALRLSAASASTGFAADCNLSNQRDDLGLEAHCGAVLVPAVDELLRPLPGLGSVMTLYPEVRMMPGLTPADSFPPNKSSHQSGGPDRCFTVRAGVHMLRGLDDAQMLKGLATIRAYVTATLANRPVCHRLDSVCQIDGDINPGTPEAWNTDKFTAAGWNAYDVAHAHFAPEHLIGQVGDPLGVLLFALRWSLFTKAHPARTDFWHNQERAVGVALENDVMATELGLGAGDEEALRVMFAGVKPKRSLNDRVARIVTDFPKWLDAWSKDLDDRKLPIIAPKDWQGHGPQLQGHYTFQNAQLLFGMARALASNLLRPELAVALANVIVEHAEYVIHRAWVRGTGKLAWAFGSTTFSDLEAQDAIAAATAMGKPKAGNDPLAVLGAEGGACFVGTLPKLQDVEMTCAALYLAQEAVATVGQSLTTKCLDASARMRAVLPAIDTSAYNQSSKPFTRYLTVADAVLQRLAAVA